MKIAECERLHRIQVLSEKISDVRDEMGDLRRLIDQWERWGFDAMPAYRRMDEYRAMESEWLEQLEQLTK